mgnify:CR=1 FL=1
MRNNRGFTLIEVLAVIVIIAIIMAIVTPVAIGVINDSRHDAYNNQIRNIEYAARGYIAEHGTSIPELAALNGTHTITLATLITGGYIETPVKNPLTNTNFSELGTSVVVTKNSYGTYDYIVNVN